jgi:thioredoxin-like negative regulator of GroEL
MGTKGARGRAHQLSERIVEMGKIVEARPASQSSGVERKTPLLVGAAGTAAPVTARDATFAAEVERPALPVLVDAWAPWSGQCRMIAPMVDQLAAELAGRALVAKLNIDEPGPMIAPRRPGTGFGLSDT